MSRGIFIFLLISWFSGEASAEEEGKSYEEIDNELTEQQLEIEKDLEDYGFIQAEEEEHLQKLDEKMIQVDSEITNKKKDMEETESRIKKAAEGISSLEESLKSTKETLDTRLKAVQQYGGDPDYLTFLFDAASIGDFLERLYIFHKAAEQDHRLLKTYGEELKELAELEAALARQQVQLEEETAEMKAIHADYRGQSGEKLNLVTSLYEEEKELKEQLETVQNNKAVNRLAKQEMELEQLEKEAELRFSLETGKNKKKRQEAGEMKKTEENYNQQKERSKKEIAEDSGKEDKSSELTLKTEEEKQVLEVKNLNEENKSEEIDEEALLVPGLLHRPADGRVTSAFNPKRIHPITGEVRAHNGTDFGGEKGRNIYAAESGTVAASGWRKGFGNTILLDHLTDEEKYTTLYAHLAFMNVKEGDTVTKGDIIAEMGTTGLSTGIHLHFEVHPGGYRGRESAVDPESYLH
ncbi:M23 family metallopeptidase [Alkalicoccus halolimnae]|uniref:Peptidoglycan DD-metalloendopeptidase family protein n=1 Tax=Alkalicoccus halolimnae TaxID=1667239 RepID=A0A5C7FIZ2_9BACI|nr:M23 family metallopeptidase [Alkalicoccus halolimnae]TXF84339.1 peptidoglycan DD-metalloendopeptidase family protein [Alkalicoccus halolimnae]